jgi:hypothetical protein
MKRKVLLLACWIAAALFPFGYLTLLSRTYARVFNFVFDAEAAHVIMHMFIFFGMMVLLFVSFGGAAMHDRRRWLWFYVVVAAMAVTQESIQLWYKGHAWGAEETFDLVTDLMGATLGLIFLMALNGLRSRPNLKFPKSR